MEPVGVVLGAAGLFHLYKEAATSVHSIKNYHSESLRLVSRYNATKVLFERWGKKTGVADNSVHPALEDPATKSAVAGLLASIRDVFAGADLSVARHNPSSVSATGGPGSASFRSRLKWALADSSYLLRQVEDFEAFVQKLYDLVALESLQNDEFQKLQKALIQSQRNQALDRALQWLDATTTENSYDAYCSARLETTCGWVTAHTTYQAWLSNQHTNTSKVLWIHGPAGFGKSVLCAYIIKSLRGSRRSHVYYFFCSGETEAQRDPISIIRSWIHQSIHHDESVLAAVLHYVDSSEGSKATLSDLWHLLQMVMSRNPNAVFIVDGFDECPRTTTARIDLHRNRGDILHELIEVTTKANAATRLLVVSREEGDIKSELRSYGPHPPGIELYELAISKDDVAPDVGRFAKHIVSEKLTKNPDQFHQDLAGQIALKSDGMFLWIRLQSQKLRPRKGKRQLLRTVDEMPTDLVRIYERNWNDIQNFPDYDRQRAEAVLRWVTFAERPLTIAELSEAVAVLDNNEDGPQFDELPSPFDGEYVDSEILGLCGPFLELRAAGPDEAKWEFQTVHLIHFSAVEFLLGQHPGGPFSDHMLQHHHLTQNCLKYLDHCDTWQGEDLKDMGFLFKRPFQEYAVYNWYAHVNACGQYKHEVKSRLTSFFDVSNSNWDNWRRRYESHKNAHPEGEIGPGGRIYYAAQLGFDGVLKYLHNNGLTNLNETGGYFGNPLQAAAATGQMSTLKFLLEKGANLHANGRHGSALHAAALLNQEEVVRQLILHGASVFVIDDVGQTPLCYAVRNGYYAITRHLLNSNSDPSIRAYRGVTPIAIAAIHGYLEIAMLLLQNGADFNVRDDDQETPLSWAAGEGHIQFVRFLLDYGADHSTRNRYGLTPLILAAWRGHCDVVMALLDRGADPTVATASGITALEASAGEGADLSQSDMWGVTALGWAALSGHDDFVKVLLDYGADPELGDLEGRTALLFAASQGHLEVVRTLLDSGADILASATICGTCATSIHFACEQGHDEVVKLLLERGVSVDLRAQDGSTPLHYASRGGHEKVVKILLAKHGSPYRQDLFGRIPFQYASPVLREKFPEWESLEAPTEVTRQRVVKDSVRTIAATPVPMENKDFALLHFPSASVVFDQTVQIEPESKQLTHNIECSMCDEELFTKWYICTTCFDCSLCGPCMAKYIEGDQPSSCSEHDFLRVPSDDWDPRHQSDMYTENFGEWLKELSLRYQVANI
ncbi:ankyrin repeat-containing domain protein [Aspergillus lucknowensis]|uniref:Ankyrin repeat-containing domain protein n=1 Tax=Aspergillus lucknowensis TaxID=176173 RepID=A0ABR4LIN1_9EURO